MMSNINQKESERLNQILLSTTLTKTEISDIIGISRQLFEKYIGGVYDIQKITRRLYELGFNINWIYGGEGGMHNKSSDKSEFDIINKYDFRIQNDNVKEWIDKSFKDIDSFNKSSRIDYIDFINRFENALPLNYKQYSELKRLGCNMKWTITGIGSMYSRSLAGNKLRKEYKQNQLNK